MTLKVKDKPQFARVLGSAKAFAFAAFGGWLLPESLAADDSQFMESFESEVVPILDRYCYDCHGYGSDKGGVVLDEFGSDGELRDYRLWHRALKNIESGLMPPSDEDQPSHADKEVVLDWIKRKAFQLDPQNPDPGKVTLRRLNRVEYRNSIKALLDYDFDTTAEFPADDTGHGFDNNGDVLTISPMLLEKYLDAAQKIIGATVPTQPLVVAQTSLSGQRFVPEGGEETGGWVRQFSYYEPTQASATHNVTHDGDYEVVLDLTAIETYVNNQFDLNECRLVFEVDGEVALDRKFVREGYKSFEFRFPYNWKEGEHRFALCVEPLTPDREQIRDLRLQLNSVHVRGPMDESHWVKPGRYDRFFPESVPHKKGKRRTYAEAVLEDFASRAFRRPVESDTLKRLTDLALYSGNQDGQTFESGIAQAMVAVLASPRFLFREEDVLPHEGEGYALVDEWSLASRLSYFLWSSMPDEILFEHARKGTLRANLESEVARMLADGRSNNFIENFVGQWLQARDIESVQISDFAVWLRENPNPELTRAREDFRRLREIPDGGRTPEQEARLAEARDIFFASFRIPKPDLGGDVRRAMKSESEKVFEYVIRENRSLLELIDADYTFLNEALAKHYGIDGVEGKEMRLYQLPEGSARGGVLTQGTVLTVTSNPTRTSPVKRGVFILDNILGTPPPPPPPNIPALEDVASEEELAEMSLRETLALHARKRACRSCHLRMDPLGLALENFNAMGRWREVEMNLPIEPEGELITGESFTDIRGLKKIIATERQDDFYRCMTEKLMTYALGRGLEYYDVDTLDTLVQSLKDSDGRPSALIMGIIESPAFQKRRPVSSTDVESIATGEESSSKIATLN